MTRSDSGDVRGAGFLRGVERALVIMPSWVGDTIMATPVLRALRQALPQARIAALFRPGLHELLDGAPWIDQAVTAGKGGISTLWRTGALIRSLRPQAVLLLPNSFRSAVAARLGGAAMRVGYARDRRTWLLTHALPPPPRDVAIPAIDYYAALAEWALDLRAIDRRPELAITDRERDAADQILTGTRRPFALLNPGASKPGKRWPIERFAAVADALAERHGLGVVATGSAKESHLLDVLAARARAPITNLASCSPAVTLGSLKAIVQRSEIMITNDTGPRHIAIALGRPVVTLFGPTDHRWTTPPTPTASEHILLAEPFLPTPLLADRHPNACAIDRIPVGDVLDAIRRLLASSVSHDRPQPGTPRAMGSA